MLQPGGCAATCPGCMTVTTASGEDCGPVALAKCPGIYLADGTVCSQRCLDQNVPSPTSCTDMQGLLGTGGCAEACPDCTPLSVGSAEQGNEQSCGTADLVRNCPGFLDSSGKLCYDSCSRAPDNCFEAAEFTEAGGCASSCPDCMPVFTSSGESCGEIGGLCNTKVNGKQCYESCPGPPKTCDEALTMISAGGCAASCPDCLPVSTEDGSQCGTSGEMRAEAKTEEEAAAASNSGSTVVVVQQSPAAMQTASLLCSMVLCMLAFALAN